MMRTNVVNPSWLVLLLALIAVLVPASAVAAEKSESDAKPDETSAPVVRSYGAETGYRTEVTSQKKGTLSEEDRRQVAILTAQIFQHIDEAHKAVDANNTAKALDEVEKGRMAIHVIRSLLPRTTVTTKTTAPNGTVAYEDRREVQEDQIPLFEGLLSTKSFAPIIASKQEAQESVELKGVRLVGSETIVTEAFAHLDYVEGQLEKAFKALKDEKPDAAGEALVAAQVRGVEFRFRKEDTPLAAARDALWLVKRALEENNATQAQINLNLARHQLELYRSLLPDGQRQDDVKQMMTEVVELEDKLQAELAQRSDDGNDDTQARRDEKTRQGNAVTRWWEQINDWFKKRSGSS